MEIVLLERIAKLGQMGDVVRVRDGYARNFLLPTKKAMRATPENLQQFEQQRAELEARNLEQKTEAEAVANHLSGTKYIAIRQAGESGQLYGSVSTRDIAAILQESAVSIERHQVRLSAPIKSIGLHDVVLALHPEVDCKIVMNVARSEEEAERQARGEDVLDTEAGERDEQDSEVAQDDGAIAAEDVFERPEDAAEVVESADLAAAGDDDAPEVLQSEPDSPEPQAQREVPEAAEVNDNEAVDKA